MQSVGEHHTMALPTREKEVALPRPRRSVVFDLPKDDTGILSLYSACCIYIYVPVTFTCQFDT